LIGQQAGFMTALERSKATGIRIATLRHIERGSFHPRAPIVDKLSQTYGRSVEDIERALSLGVEDLVRRDLERVQAALVRLGSGRAEPRPRQRAQRLARRRPPGDHGALSQR